MHEICEFDGKSARVRLAMFMDNVESHANSLAQQIANEFCSSRHFCNRVRIELDHLDDDMELCGILPTDFLRGEVISIFNERLRRALVEAGFRDVREVKRGGAYWYEFYRY